MNEFLAAVLVFLLKYMGDAAWDIVLREARLRYRIEKRKADLKSALERHEAVIKLLNEGDMSDEEKVKILVDSARALIRG